MRRALCLAASIALLAFPAAAQITPDTLWAHWQSGEGALTADGERSSSGGDALTITGATVEIGTLSARIGEMTLSPEDDGTRIALPDTWVVESGGLTATITAPLTKSNETATYVHLFVSIGTSDDI